MALDGSTITKKYGDVGSLICFFFVAAPIKTSDVREEYVCELERFNMNPPDERACCRYAECKQRSKIISLPR